MSIFLFKTHPINLTNIAQTLLLENTRANSYQACEYSIDKKFINLVSLGGFAKSITSNTQHWRSHDWSRSLPILESQIQQAQSLDQTIIFGSHLDDQIKLLKQHFQDKLCTVAVNYHSNQYRFLLRNVAEYHVYLNPGNQSADHFESEFDRLGLVASSSVTNCDYEILVDDFFDPAIMQSHFKNLGFPLASPAIDIYYTWLSYW